VVTVAGVVTEVTARHEGAQFASDVFLISDGVLPAQVQEVAEVATTRAEPEVWVPPQPGSAVYRAVDDERDRALCFDRMDRKVPIGLGRDGLPVYVDLDFLDGARGAHVSISGISGVATKTSFALFLLHSLFRSGVLGNRATNAKALVFSVKGEDLLFLDAPNNRLDDGAVGGTARKQYERLELPAEPFRSVAFFAPPRPGDVTGRPNVTGRTDGVGAFWWTIAEFCQQELLPYVFADVEDERNQYTMVVHQVATRLRTQGAPAGIDGAWTVDGTLLRTYDDLVDFVVAKVGDEDSRWEWAGPAVGTGTVNAFVRRLRSSLKAIRPLVRADLPRTGQHAVSTEGQQVTVVDLHALPDRGQRFVVGVVLRAETERKEVAGPGGLLFTMIDELNKYAPREGSSPIKELVLDIAERGRSLGIILIGAQQTASEVERRVIAHSAVKVVGRLDPAEAGRPEYGFLPASQRIRATLATPGAMFVSQPGIPVPLAVEFPFPAWATRASERGGPPAGSTVDDPFDLLPADDPPPF
jgi:DNA helicase HerA-like ATPase